MNGPRCRRDQGAANGGQGRAGGGSGLPRYAAIDLGTNNCRLLVAERRRDGFRVVDAFSRIVRLGEGLARDGHLSHAAMTRAIQALKVCAEKLSRHRITRIRAVATEACRQARNAETFLHRVKADTGLDLEIISQEEEARLALTGCAPLLQAEIPNALVFDIGGGSTEIIRLRAQPDPAEGESPRLGIGAWHSMPIGVVGLAERYGARDVREETYEQMVADVESELEAVAVRQGIVDALATGRMQMIGTSGTVTTLAGVYQNLQRYDRRRVDGCYLAFDTVHAVSRRIAAMDHTQRRAHPCIGQHRADLVVPGCAILEAICRTWPVGSLRVADRGLREGMLLQMMAHVGADGLATPHARAGVDASAPG